MIRSWVASAPRQFCRQLALAQHQHAVAHGQDFRQLGGRHQHGRTFLGQVAHQGVDLGLGADVDAARRFVEQKDVRLA